MSEYRPRNNLEPSGGSHSAIIVMVVVGAFALIALGAGGADGSSAEASAETAAESGAELAAVPADREAEGGDENDGDPGGESAEEGEGGDAPSVASAPSFDAIPRLPESLDFLARAVEEGGRLVVDSPAGRRALTIDPGLQKQVTRLLRSYQTPYSAVVAIDPRTGRVLALAEHSHDAPEVRGLPLRALYPAASVFKIITGAALLSAGVSPEESVCYHGGKRRLSEKLLANDPRRDKNCQTLSKAMGHSTNVIFAKLADRKLAPAALRSWAERFGFNAPLPFAQPADVSAAVIPDEKFGFAKAAAGFGEVFLSPLHGALIAAAIGNRGVSMSPVLFDDEVSAPRRIVSQATASTLADMLETSVTEGTARRAFRERGRNALGSAKAAGKTGSLADKDPFRDYSWFVGFAPKENPTIAVAAVVVNGPLWRVRAPYVARETMRIFLKAEAGLKQAKATSSGNRG